VPRRCFSLIIAVSVAICMLKVQPGNPLTYVMECFVASSFFYLRSSVQSLKRTTKNGYTNPPTVSLVGNLYDASTSAAATDSKPFLEKKKNR